MSIFARGAVLGGMVGVLALTYMWGRWDERTNRPIPLAGVAHAAASSPSVSPVGVVDPRDVYYPGTEALAPDEMRVTACGTGMPNSRPKQAAACFLVELGNGDKFIFDVGSGSAERLSAMKIPYDYLDKENPPVQVGTRLSSCRFRPRSVGEFGSQPVSPPPRLSIFSILVE